MRIYPLFFFASLLVACGQKPEPDRNELRVILRGTNAQLDPTQVLDRYGGSILRNVFQTLYRYKYLARPYELTTDLAAELPTVSADGLVYTIVLRKDAKFFGLPGGNRPVEANDVVYSLLRHFDPAVRSRWRWLYRDRIVGAEAWSQHADYEQPPAGIAAIDAHTLRIRLNQPFPSFVHTLAAQGAGIVPKEAVESKDREFGVAPIGSGPYRLTEFNAFNAILTLNQSNLKLDLGLEREPLDTPMWITPPRRIRIDFVVDPGTAWLTFLEGGDVVRLGGPVIHHVADVTPQGLQLKPEFAEQIKLVSHLEFGVTRLEINLDGPLGSMAHRSPAELRALRCALVKSFDWRNRNRLFYVGLAQVYPGIIPPSLAEFDPTLDRNSIELDIAGAKKLLADHNWTTESLPEIKYGFQTGVETRQGFEHFRSMLEAIGYPREKVVPLAYANWGDVLKAVVEGDIDVYLPGWTLDYPDAENVLQLYYGPNRAPGSNYTRYANPDYDRAYDRLVKLQPGPERTRLAGSMNQMLIEDCVFIGSVSRTVVFAVRKNLHVVPDNNLLQGTWQRFAWR